MNYAVLLAGGTGTRLKFSKLPKQFLELDNVSVLESVVDKFLICDQIDKIILVVNEVWIDHARAMLSNDRYKAVDICTGGATRQDSLYNGVKWIESNYGISNEDKVVSHDVARPFITLKIISDNLEALKTYRAADTVIPATDTIVRSVNGNVISDIPQRNQMYQGQTPQSFYIADFIKLYESLDAEYLNSLTDAARMFAENGIEVALVRGSEFNIKITTDFDLMIAKYLVGIK